MLKKSSKITDITLELDDDILQQQQPKDNRSQSINLKNCPVEKNIKETCQNVAEKLAGSGIQHIFEANYNRFARIAWLFFITLSFTLCCYNIGKSFVDFFAYDVITNIKVYTFNVILKNIGPKRFKESGVSK